MTVPLKISAADLGTNTIKVTHAIRLSNGDLADMIHASDTVRLGFGIEHTGSIESARFEATIAFLKDQESIGREYGSTIFTGVATEALRIAANGQELLERIHNETSWQVEIITGDREAELTYLGLSDLVPSGEDCAIVDIGGGSTEIVVIRDGEVTLQRSVPVGSGRLADRHFYADPPGSESVADATESAREALAAWLTGQQPVSSIMLAGGSGLFMNQLLEQLEAGVPFTLEQLRNLSNHLAHAPSDETVERIEIPQARALVLPASVSVAVAILEYFQAKSAQGVPSGIRMGLIRSYK